MTARELQEALLAAAQVARVLVTERVESEGVEHLESGLAVLTVLRLAHGRMEQRIHQTLTLLMRRRDQHVLQNRHPAPFTRDLEGPDETLLGDPVSGPAGNVRAGETHMALARLERA